MSNYESRPQDDCDVIEANDPWKGPFPEYTKYGTLTGCSYVRCRDCGREVLTGRKEFATHRDGCRFNDESKSSSSRAEPTRHEPADFGGGESTGVIDL